MKVEQTSFRAHLLACLKHLCESRASISLAITKEEFKTTKAFVTDHFNHTHPFDGLYYKLAIRIYFNQNEIVSFVRSQ